MAVTEPLALGVEPRFVIELLDEAGLVIRATEQRVKVPWALPLRLSLTAGEAAQARRLILRLTGDREHRERLTSLRFTAPSGNHKSSH